MPAAVAAILAAFLPAQDRQPPPEKPAADFAAAVVRLAKADTLDCEMVGEDGGESPTWRAYLRFRDLGDAATLVSATTHAHPIVRCYAMRALADRKFACDWRALLLAHVRDTAPVTTFCGCIEANTTAGDAMFEFARERQLLGAEAELDLAEALVRQQSPLQAREHALRSLRFRDAMEGTIRALVAKGDAPALIALARYGRPGDVATIATRVAAADFRDNCPFLAARLVAAPALLPALAGLRARATTRLHEDGAWRLQAWLAAIAATGDAPAAHFLLDFLQGTPVGDPLDRRDLVDVYAAVLAEHPAAAVFDDLRAELKKRRAPR